MSEPELLAEFPRVADACERLDREVARATDRQGFNKDAQEVNFGP
jgi:hypothetical protein